MKDRIRKYIGEQNVLRLKAVLDTFSLIFSTVSDKVRYLKYAYIGVPRLNVDTLGSLIVKDAHRLEKGLSLPNFRRGFGENVIRRLIDNLRLFNRRYGCNEFSYKYGVNALQSYSDAHNSDNNLTVELCKQFLKDEKEKARLNVGVDSQTRDVFFSDTSSSFRAFNKSRRSARNFTGETVEKDLIKQAVDMAKYAPSVCNRQSARVHFSNRKADMFELLKLQNGNRGFGQDLGAVLVITSKISTFEGAGERNQMYIDGGIFLMNILHALHFLEVGACALNWSVKSSVDKKCRTVCNIPEDEVIISFIGIGYVPEKFDIACSPRLPENDILQEIKTFKE